MGLISGTKLVLYPSACAVGTHSEKLKQITDGHSYKIKKNGLIKDASL